MTKESCKTKTNEILDQKDLTRWFEMTPTKEEMDETNWKSAILGYVLVIFGQVIIITGEFSLQELGWKILYGILLGSSVWAVFFFRGKKKSKEGAG